MNKLSELWENKQRKVAEEEVELNATEFSEMASKDEACLDEGMQEEIIFKDDGNSWIVDLLSAPLDIDPLLAMLDREIQAVHPFLLHPLTVLTQDGTALSEFCVVKPEEEWAAYRIEGTPIPFSSKKRVMVIAIPVLAVVPV